MIERQRLGRGISKKAKKARKKADGVVRHARKAKTKSVGRSVTLSVRTSYWTRVNREVHLLICTDDEKYEKLRKYVGKESKPTQFAIVTSIAATIGAYIGVAASVIAPLVTLALMAVLQVGKNAWCAGQA